MHRSHGRYGHVTSRRGENQKHGNDRWTASPRHVPLFISQAGRERASTHALCLIFGRMGGRASQRRNQSIKSIWRLPYPPLNCPLRFVLLLSFCHRSGSTKTRTGCLSVSQSEGASFGASPRKTSELFPNSDRMPRRPRRHVIVASRQRTSQPACSRQSANRGILSYIRPHPSYGQTTVRQIQL